MIPYGRQHLDDDDIRAVVDVLRGDWLTQGPAVERFEATLADAVEARHAIAFSSGTAALHAAAAAAGLGPGHTVHTSPLSFAASAACARYVGADVAFTDIDPATLNLDLAAVPEDADALVAVHYAGLPADLSRLRHRPRVLIEDAAHALGARTPDGPVGNCARSDMAVFSFHPVKAVTTGEGGAVTTNDDGLAETLRVARSHGMRRRPELGEWYYEINGPGWNYRLTDMGAALGTSQLAKLNRFIDRRNELAARYRALLADLPLALPPLAPAGWRHAYHLFPVRVPRRREVYQALHAAGIRAQVHYIPIYRHPWYAAFGSAESCPHTETAYQGLLSLPMFPAMRDADQDTVVEVLRAALRDGTAA